MLYHNKMESVRYRLAKASDCAALAKMRYQFRAELARATEPEAHFVRRCAAWMKKQLTGDLWRCWLAELDRSSHAEKIDGPQGRGYKDEESCSRAPVARPLVGCVSVILIEKIPNPVRESELHAYITNCYVVPELRNRAIGERLLKKAIAWCDTKRIDAVILWPSVRSRPLYLRCGFEIPADMLELHCRKPKATAGNSR